MHFYSIKPSTFTIRSDAEKDKLQRLLKTLGLTLSPLSKKEKIDLWKTVIDEDLEDTESYSDSGQSADELADDDHSKGTHVVAGSYGG